jgi:general secretion pathway protein B
MSFILEALKKAESERNRRVAPVLMDARIAPRRHGLPAWAWALGVVLLLNLGVLAWLLSRTRAPQTVSLPVTSAEPATPDQSAPAPPATPPPVAPTAPPPAPAPEAIAPLATPVAPAHANGPSLATTGDEEQLPTLQELRNAGVPLPDLALNLHVYAPSPAGRSVLLNGQRAREGEYLPNGVKVERITPTAVILEASGRRFRVAAGE